MALSYGFCLDGQDSTYTSAQFSEAFQAVFGDGLCDYGRHFDLAEVLNFTVTLGTGYAIVAGRWLENDENLSLTLTPASNYVDRYDAVAVRVDYEDRKVYLEIMADVDPAAPPRNDREYCIFLYVIFVKRGATVLSMDDITDTRADRSVCGYIKPFSDISSDVEYIYTFLRSGIDEDVARILAKGQEVIDYAEDVIADLSATIGAVTGTQRGDTMTALTQPLPNREWLLCDGSAVPPEYPELSILLGGTLPDLSPEDERWGTWMFAGPTI